MIQTKIYHTIKQNPGIHFRGLLKECSLAIGQLMYHIHRLEKKQQIIVEKQNNYTRYYTKEILPADRITLSHLRSKTAREILLILLKKDAKHSELIKTLKKSGSTISWYTNKLQKDHIIHLIDKKYKIVDKHQIESLLKAYQQSFIDKISDKFTETWE